MKQMTPEQREILAQHSNKTNACYYLSVLGLGYDECEELYLSYQKECREARAKQVTSQFASVDWGLAPQPIRKELIELCDANGLPRHKQELVINGG